MRLRSLFIVTCLVDTSNLYFPLHDSVSLRVRMLNGEILQLKADDILIMLFPVLPISHDLFVDFMITHFKQLSFLYYDNLFLSY